MDGEQHFMDTFIIFDIVGFTNIGGLLENQNG